MMMTIARMITRCKGANISSRTSLHTHARTHFVGLLLLREKRVAIVEAADADDAAAAIWFGFRCRPDIARNDRGSRLAASCKDEADGEVAAPDAICDISNKDDVLST